MFDTSDTRTHAQCARVYNTSAKLSRHSFLRNLEKMWSFSDVDNMCVFFNLEQAQVLVYVLSTNFERNLRAGGT